jgi:hypothetical protein
LIGGNGCDGKAVRKRICWFEKLRFGAVYCLVHR